MANRVRTEGDNHTARPDDHCRERCGATACRENCWVAGQPPARRDAAGKHLQGKDVWQRGTVVAVPSPVRRPSRSAEAIRGHPGVRDLPGASDDCARLDAAQVTSLAQIQPKAEKDVLDLGLEAR